MEKYFIARSDEGTIGIDFKRYFIYVDKRGVGYYTSFHYKGNDAKMVKRVIKMDTLTELTWKEVSDKEFAEKSIEAYNYYKFLHETAEALKQE